MLQCATALLFVIVLLFVKTHNVCGLTIHGPIGMQRRLCVRDTAQPMKNNNCKNLGFSSEIRVVWHPEVCIDGWRSCLKSRSLSVTHTISASPI